MRFADNLKIDWLGKRNLFYAISGTLILIGLISFVLRGLEYGIDFKGGSEIGLQFGKKIEISELRSEINKLNIGKIEIKSFGNENGVLIRTDAQELPKAIYPKITDAITKAIDEAVPGISKKVIKTSKTSIDFEIADTNSVSIVIARISEKGFQAVPVSQEPGNTQITVAVSIADWIEQSLIAKYPANKFTILKEELVGPKMGDELKRDAVIAILFSLLGILVYIGFRFKFIFALAGVVTLFHDVLITLGMMSLLAGLVPGLNLEINISVVAAFLALVGYSINDTVIVFDRIREELKIHKTGNIQEIMNGAINKTMSRTLITSGTTLVTVFVLLLTGGEVLGGFAFALTFGIFIGTYSSIFVSSTFVLEYALRKNKRIEF